MTTPDSPQPVAWLLTDHNINELQVASVQRLIDRAKHAHHCDLVIRINGQDEHYEADWLKHLVRTAPQPAPELVKELRALRDDWRISQRIANNEGFTGKVWAFCADELTALVEKYQ